MEVNCSFQRLVGGYCSQDKRSRAAEKSSVILPLRSCEKDISAQKLSVGINDVESEVDIILARASIFNVPLDRFATVLRSSRIIEACQRREITQS